MNMNNIRRISVLGGRLDNQNCRTRKISNDTIGWEERTLIGVLHIPDLERNLIYVSKMIDAGVNTLFQKDSKVQWY
jgi:hypothetical protein